MFAVWPALANAVPALPAGWTLVWGDDFNGSANTGVDTGNWRYATGTGYPGGAANWGTGEIETMTSSTSNVYRDGAGHLVIKPLRDGAGNWTSGRTNWPSIGEIDLMEAINGRGTHFATLHCGVAPGGPCNEFTGLGSGERPCGGCLTGFHTYAMELDRSTSPEQIRWYLDGNNFFTVTFEPGRSCSAAPSAQANLSQLEC